MTIYSLGDPPTPGVTIEQVNGAIADALEGFEGGGGASSLVQSDFDAPYSYIGVAPIGSLTSDSSWTITRIDTTGPVVTAVAVDATWDDRSTESYE